MEETLYAAADALLKSLREKHLTLGFAESCTGGLAAAAVVAVPGASDVFLGSIVSYANAVKHDLLGVPATVLESAGAKLPSLCCCIMTTVEGLTVILP